MSVVGLDFQHSPRRNRVAAIQVLVAAAVVVPELDLDQTAAPVGLSAAARTAHRAGDPAADSSVSSAVVPKCPPFHRDPEEVRAARAGPPAILKDKDTELLGLDSQQ